MALFKDRIDRSPRAFGRARRGRAVERASVVVAGRRRARRGRAGVCGAARRARDGHAPSGRRARRLELLTLRRAPAHVQGVPRLTANDTFVKGSTTARGSGLFHS